MPTGPTGEVIETPTADLPFKAVIRQDRDIIQERFFASRPEAEIYVFDTVRGLKATDVAGGEDESAAVRKPL